MDEGRVDRVRQSLFVHEQAEWPSDVPLLATKVVVSDGLPARQQLQERPVSVAEAHRPRPETSRQKAVEGPETGSEAVQRVRQKPGASSDASAQTHAAKNRRTLPPTKDCPAPGPTLRSRDATDDIAGLQNPWVVLRVAVPPRADE